MASIFSYVKTLWQDGVTAITAARLNHIEQGISDAADSIKTLGDSVCQLDTHGGTTECVIQLKANNEFIITAKNDSGRCVSLNCYADKIVLYDEALKKRIGAYAKTE